MFTKSEIAAACRTYGPLLTRLPVNVDGTRLLWALAGNESSFGANCTPRLENSYLTGKYSRVSPMPHLLALFGEDAAKSYGPWQLMFVNCIGYRPEEFQQLNKCVQATIAFLNRELARQAPQTLEEIFDLYNSGNWRDANVPHDYILKGVRNYEVPLA